MTTVKKELTYSELRKIKPFDWNKFLNKRKYTEIELRDARNLAGDWITCACGNQCSIIERSSIGEPIDEELSDLGYEFHINIKTMHIYSDNVGIFKRNKKEAKEILLKIEARSTILIEEKLAEAK